jgi:hypothetical protein
VINRVCCLTMNWKGMDVNVSSGVSPAARLAKPTVRSPACESRSASSEASRKA